MVKVDGAEHAPIARVGDIELYQWDAELLQPRRWLNDALIAFAFEHMAQSLTEEVGVVHIEPTVAFAAAMVPPDTLAEMISGGPAGKARRRLACNYAQPVRAPCTCHACTIACTMHAPCMHHAYTMHVPRAPPHRDTRVLQARLARLRKARLVVLPVNDNPDSERSGGGHWSCLAFRRLADGGALDRVGASPG